MNCESLKIFPITVNDIDNANKSVGVCNHDRLKGTAQRQQPNRMVRVEARVNIPRDWCKLNKFMTLMADVVFFSGLSFFPLSWES